MTWAHEGATTADDDLDALTFEDEEQPSEVGDEDTSNSEIESGREGSGESGEKKTRRARRGVDRGLVRRVAAKVVEVTEADRSDVSVLAGLLGTSEDPVEVTVGIMTAGRANLAPLAEVENFAVMDATERAIGVMTMDRPKRNDLWKTLQALGVVDGNIPRADANAALELSKVEIPDIALSQIERVRDLAKKS